jgi:hypothetical protein
MGKGHGQPLYASKRDDNDKEITAALRNVGADVEQWGVNGAPDKVVAYRGNTYLIEIKMPGKKLTTKQVEFHAMWRGPICIAFTVEDALRHIGAIQ